MNPKVDESRRFGESLCSTFSLQQFDDLLWKAESKLRTSEKRLIAARKKFREARRRVKAMREIRKEILR
jgi:hypothetical protein